MQGTRAITIDAPPGRVWPWLAQIGYHGYDRAGWYALDLADNDGVPSAPEVIPAFQHPRVGQLVGEEGFTIRALEPNRLLLLSYHFPRTDWVWKQGLWPRFGHCSWAFVLRPLPGGRTRLITRTRYRAARLDLSVVFWPLFLVADLIVQPRMLRGIKRRVESTAGRAAGQPTVGQEPPRSHQLRHRRHVPEPDGLLMRVLHMPGQPRIVTADGAQSTSDARDGRAAPRRPGSVSGGRPMSRYVCVESRDTAQTGTERERRWAVPPGWEDRRP